LISIASSILGGLIVAVANHFMTKRRDEHKQKGDLRIAYLIESWKRIERASNTENATPEQKSKLYDELEDALASITLLGTRQEVDLASQLAHAMGRGGSADSTKLLNGLRNGVRSELGLEAVDGMTFFVRMKRMHKG